MFRGIRKRVFVAAWVFVQIFYFSSFWISAKVILSFLPSLLSFSPSLFLPLPLPLSSLLLSLPLNFNIYVIRVGASDEMQRLDAELKRFGLRAVISPTPLNLMGVFKILTGSHNLAFANYLYTKYVCYYFILHCKI